MSYQTTNRTVFIQAERLLEEAMKQGPESTLIHLKAWAYLLGAQMAILSKPNDIPVFIDHLVTEMGRGINDATLEMHGIKGSMSVQVHAVSRF